VRPFGVSALQFQGHPNSSTLHPLTSTLQSKWPPRAHRAKADSGSPRLPRAVTSLSPISLILVALSRSAHVKLVTR